RQVAKMKKASEVSVLGGCALLIDKDGNVVDGNVKKLNYPNRHEDIVRAMGSFCAMAHPSVMYRRDDVLKVGGYNPMTRHYEDYDLWVRMAEQGFRFANLSDVLIDYRLHDKSV